eukprot:5423624-Amphidinium_carterae.1
MCTDVKKHCRAGQLLESWELAEWLRLGGVHKFVEAAGKTCCKTWRGGSAAAIFFRFYSCKDERGNTSEGWGQEGSCCWGTKLRTLCTTNLFNGCGCVDAAT